MQSHTLRTLAIAVVVASAAAGARAQGPIIRDANRTFQQPVVSWKTMRERHIVMQQYDYSCGAAAIATVAKYFWGDNVTERQFLLAILKDMTVDDVKERVENGLSMTDLKDGAVAEGYLAAQGKLDLHELYEAKVPLIIRLNTRGYEHFVVLRGFADDRVFLADPVRGNIRMPLDRFLCEWNEGNPSQGVVLAIVKKDTDPPTDSPLSVRHPWYLPVQHEMQAGRRAIQIFNGGP
jgi:uncharacterized protein